MQMDTIQVSKIKIGDRARKILGDLAGLVKSIDEVGLLHPPVITPRDHELVCGWRRIEAWKLSKYATTPIPIRVLDIKAMVRGEADENLLRKNFSPSECVAILRKARVEQGDEAQRRLKSRRKLEPGEKRLRITRLAAPIAGVSDRTLEKMEAIVIASERDPKRYGDLVEQLDRTGKVDRVFKEMRQRYFFSNGAALDRRHCGDQRGERPCVPSTQRRVRLLGQTWNTYTIAGARVAVQEAQLELDALKILLRRADDYGQILDSALLIDSLPHDLDLKKILPEHSYK